MSKWFKKAEFENENSEEESEEELETEEKKPATKATGSSKWFNAS